ncbi:unnamed protein product [Thelazia callipaeda]|uniref:U1-type domain-containing protein n=1 Tax=Thelazia callipaeda TaxID=103827 RepID=A0A0N5CR21_THECL|nr:unnamed protein product [Thelazia callipaeda]
MNFSKHTLHPLLNQPLKVVNGDTVKISTVDNNLNAEDLSSVIGLMAYGSFKDDVENNLRKRRKKNRSSSRKHAGHSTIAFHSSPNHYEESKSIQRNYGRIQKNEAITGNDSEEAKNATDDSFESSDNYKCLELTSAKCATHYTDSKAYLKHKNDSHTFYANLLQKVLQKYQTKDTILKRNQGSSKASENQTSKTNGKKITETVSILQDSANCSAENSNIPSLQKTFRIPTKDKTLLYELSDTFSDSYDSTQKHSDISESSKFQSTQYPSKLSSHCWLPPQSPLPHSNEYIPQNTVFYASSVHSSDFEIPSYLNDIAVSSKSNQSVIQIPKVWSDAERVRSLQRSVPKCNTKQKNFSALSSDKSITHATSEYSNNRDQWEKKSCIYDLSSDRKHEENFINQNMIPELNDHFQQGSKATNKNESELSSDTHFRFQTITNGKRSHRKMIKHNNLEDNFKWAKYHRNIFPRITATPLSNITSESSYSDIDSSTSRKSSKIKNDTDLAIDRLEESSQEMLVMRMKLELISNKSTSSGKIHSDLSSACQSSSSLCISASSNSTIYESSRDLSRNPDI